MNYEITVITKTGQVVEIRCDDYQITGDVKKNIQLLNDGEEIKEVALFFDIDGFVVKEVESE